MATLGKEKNEWIEERNKECFQSEVSEEDMNFCDYFKLFEKYPLIVSSMKPSAPKAASNCKGDLEKAQLNVAELSIP